MTSRVLVRICSFIPDAWVPFGTAPIAGIRKMEFEGDHRGFTPFSERSRRFRTAQEFDVDFEARTVLYKAATGVTRVRIILPNDRVAHFSAQAKNACLTISEEQWALNTVTFRAKSTCANPMLPGAPSADYDLQIRVSNKGLVQVIGKHDGYPAYEVYKKINNVFTGVYLFDPSETQQGVWSLFPPMDVQVNVTQ